MSFRLRFAIAALLTAIAVLLIAAAAGAIYYQRHDMYPERAAVARVALVPFANLTADPGLDWVARALPAAAVRQAGGLSRVRAFYAETENTAIAQGATHILQGTFDEYRGVSRIHWSLQITGRRRTRATGLYSASPNDWLDVSRWLAGVVRDQVRPGGTLLPLDVHNEQSFRALGESLSTNDAAQKAAVLERAVAADSSSAYCWETLAHAYIQSGQREKGGEALGRGMAHSAAMEQSGRLRLELLDATLRNDSRRRTDVLEQLAKVVPSDPGILNFLAEAMVERRRPKDALAAYRAAYEADPSRSELLNMIGYAEAWAGNSGEAVKWLKRYQTAEPDSANPEDSLGEILLMAGRFTEAEQAFLRSHAKDPTFNGGVGLEKAALARWLNGDERESGELLEKYLTERAQIGDPLVVLRRARWQYLFGQAREAQANLKLLASRPETTGSSLAASYLSLYALQSGQEEEARKLAGLAGMSARDPLSLYAAGVAQYLASPGGNPTGSDPAAQLQLKAMALTLRGRLEEAAAVWEEALKITPISADALPREMLAQVCVALGRTERAAELVGKHWPLLTPDQMLLFDSLVYPNLFYVRGAVAQQQQRAEDARRYYEQFLHAVGSRPDPLGMARRARAAIRL